ncbi:hypothetical protein AB0N06_37045 [Streptomyces sp. NPDC051020]|uniref:hypothetical protein n=1 Tax=Streptomyces sp. NPDC051020 TaxID=3155409 RepID=UPI00343399F2
MEDTSWDREVSTVNQFYLWAIEQDLVRANPVRQRAAAAWSPRRRGVGGSAARQVPAEVDALVDLPPMVIADMLGIHPKTAERWATLAGENWTELLVVADVTRPRYRTAHPADGYCNCRGCLG